MLKKSIILMLMTTTVRSATELGKVSLMELLVLLVVELALLEEYYDE
jgi:hypothetical protein